MIARKGDFAARPGLRMTGTGTNGGSLIGNATGRRMRIDVFDALRVVDVLVDSPGSRPGICASRA